MIRPSIYTPQVAFDDSTIKSQNEIDLAYCGYGVQVHTYYTWEKRKEI
jgi:hypothetical protein